ncbi:actin-like ATPase domain-containing protein, partial [Ramicandelaber brevisporus]
SPVLFAYPVNWTKADIQRTTEYLFSVMRVPGIAVLPQPVLTLFGCAMTSGLVIDAGHASITVTPVIDSNVIGHAVRTVEAGGRDVMTRFFNALPAVLSASDQSNATLPDPAFVHATMERALCSDGIDPATKAAAAAAAAAQSKKNITFRINGQSYSIPTSVSHACTEVLFDGSSGRVDGDDNVIPLPLSEAIRQAVLACPSERRNELYGGVVLTGGCSALGGFTERLETEFNGGLLAVSDHFSTDSQAREFTFAEVPEYYMPWRKLTAGEKWASMLGSAVVAKQLFIHPSGFVSHSEYAARGPSVIFKK